MQVFITGIAGFIGAHVAEEMTSRGWKVTGIDDLSGGAEDNLPAGVEFHKYDCTKPLDELLARVKPEVVVHLAAYAAEGLSHHIPNFNYINNLVGTSNVLAAAYRVGVRHFVFTSSIAAYGHPSVDSDGTAGAAKLTEDTLCVPCDPYGIAKLACEQQIKTFRDYHGGPSFTIFRPHNVFGPKQNISDPFRNVVGIFFRRLQEGLRLPVFGDGSQSRSFSYIDVVAKSIVESCVAEQAVDEVFNIGGDQSLTVLELAEAIQRVTGKETGVEHLPARKEVMHAHADHEKARNAFPKVFEEAISVEEGLRLTAEYLAGRPIPKKTPCPSPIEVSDHLPPSWLKDLKLEN